MQQDPSGNRGAGRRFLDRVTFRSSGTPRFLMTRVLAIVVSTAFAATGLQTLANTAAKAAPGDVIFTLNAVEFNTVTQLDTTTPVLGFRYVVSPNDVGNPADPNPNMHPGLKPLQSTETTILTSGRDADGNGTEQITLQPGKYLISLSDDAGPGGDPGHKVWGAHFEVRNGGVYGPHDNPAGPPSDTLTVSMVPFPLKLGKLVGYAFQDTQPTNGAPDQPLEAPLRGFNMEIHDYTDTQVTQDFWGNPICTTYDGAANGAFPPGNIVNVGGECLTGANGVATVNNLGPGKYEIYMNPPVGSSWQQTTTYAGGRAIDEAGVVENDAGTGVPLESLLEPIVQPTSYWFGFVQPGSLRANGTYGTGPIPAAPGTGNTFYINARRKTVVGCVRNWTGFPPFDNAVIDKREPIHNAWIALNNMDYAAEATATYVAPLINDPSNLDCPEGYIDISGVPPGNYQAFLVDEQLSYVFRIYNFQVDNSLTTTERQVELQGDDAVDTNNNGTIDCPPPTAANVNNIPFPAPPGRECTGNVGIFRFYGFLAGSVFTDNGVADDGTLINDVPPGQEVDPLVNPAAPASHPAGPTSGNGVLDCYDPATVTTDVNGVDHADWTPNGLNAPATNSNATDLQATGLPKDPAHCESMIADSGVDIRNPDGTIIQYSSTNASGHYEFPVAVSELNKFNIAEVGFTNFETTGPSLHNEFDWSKVKKLFSIAGGNLLMSQDTVEGHETFMDWGKRPYAPQTPGLIVGIVHYDSTRNEVDARLQVPEDYEPGIPDVRINLWTLGADGLPNNYDTVGSVDQGPAHCVTDPTPPAGVSGTCDDVLVNVYNGTDHWQHPNNFGPDGNPATTADNNVDPNGKCTVLNGKGQSPENANDPNFVAPVPDVRKMCGEVPLIGSQTKDGAFDGGWAFGTFCPPGTATTDPTVAYDDTSGTCANGSDPVPMTAQSYITETVVPHGYTVSAEEDVNVFHGDQFIPQIPPPACVGPMHLVHVVDNYADAHYNALAPYNGNDPSQTGVYNPSFMSVYPGGVTPMEGKHMPLCNNRLDVLKNGQNVNSDTFVFPDSAANTPNASAPDQNAGNDGTGIQLPSRWFGWVSDDINFDTDPTSIFYGEPRPIPNIPVTIRDFSGRQLTTVMTDEYGYYEALLPTTSSEFCPIPQGICPAEYIVTIDDPGDPPGQGFGPNANFNPNYLVSPLEFEAWPGVRTLLDTPLDPVAGVTCPGSTAPDFYTVDTVSMTHTGPSSAGTWTWTPVNASGVPSGPATRQVTIHGLSFGTTRGRVSLVNNRTGAVTDLTGTAGNLPVWNDTTITFVVPGTMPAASYQLLVTTATPTPAPDAVIAPDLQLTSPIGITLHLRSATNVGVGTATSSYNPSVLYVDGLNPNAADSNSGTTESAPFKTIQAAVDASPLATGTDVGGLIIVKPATYRENVILDRRVRLQGYGPGGINGTQVLLNEPDDPRRHFLGSTIDGRFWTYPTVQAAWTTRLGVSESAGRIGHPGNEPTVPGGADVTVVSNANQMLPTADVAVNRARIDGFTFMGAQGEAGGGIFANGYARNLQVSNDFFDGNQGLFGGGVTLGMPYRGTAYNASNENTDVTISQNRFIGNGGIKLAGAIGLFNGADRYQVLNNNLCTNFSAEYGAGLSQFGFSLGGTVANNTFLFNDAVDEGGGMMIGAQLASPTASPNDPRAGTGPNCLAPMTGCTPAPINITGNRFSSNESGDDGGGIRILDSYRQEVNITNNFITNNNAAHYGGGIALDDAMNVRIVNDTIAKNTDTWSCGPADCLSGSSELATGVGAGLASETLSPGAQAMLPTGTNQPHHSNPYLLNDLFYQNQVFQPGLDATGLPVLTSQGFSDMAMVGIPTGERFHPSHTTIDATSVPAPNATWFSTSCPGFAATSPCNVIMAAGSDPFVQNYTSTFDFGVAFGGGFVVNVVGPFGADPVPPGDLGNPGDYHLCRPVGGGCTSQQVIDKGVASFAFGAAQGFYPSTTLGNFNVTIFAPANDIDTPAAQFGAPPAAGFNVRGCTGFACAHAAPLPAFTAAPNYPGVNPNLIRPDIGADETIMNPLPALYVGPLGGAG